MMSLSQDNSETSPAELVHLKFLWHGDSCDAEISEVNLLIIIIFYFPLSDTENKTGPSKAI